MAGAASFENPQRFGGSDVMHRIYCYGGEFRGESRQVIWSTINFEAGKMTRQLGVHQRWIYAVALMSNTTMSNIIFGLDVRPSGVKPYKFLSELEWTLRMRWRCWWVSALIPKVIVEGRGGMVAAFCPAGPACEGVVVAWGMLGYDGAVWRRCGCAEGWRSCGRTG